METETESEFRAVVSEADRILSYLPPVVLVRLIIDFLGHDNENSRAYFALACIFIPHLIDIVKDSGQHHGLRWLFNICVLFFCLVMEGWMSHNHKVQMIMVEEFSPMQRKALRFGREAIYLVTGFRAALLLIYSLVHFRLSVKYFVMSFYLYLLSRVFGFILGPFCFVTALFVRRSDQN